MQGVETVWGCGLEAMGGAPRPTLSLPQPTR